ncbi:MAG: hypothetical protein Q7V31_08995 [Parvibaculum sp.]|uniref:hypothetical protein n=1 Tax=Parvibaculum sp. TaxID=2024848 RepID=UPI00272849BB|nr:hypothetical protein [Parvibaculum sp.]MDO8839055.1 hypothetical protein [Parvibaculum sp.]
MKRGDNQSLCLALLRADSEETVVELLKARGYWDRPELWRYYGDVENNWGQSGNQQSLAEAALAEKIVNSVDARLINECKLHGIDPSSSDAPRTIRNAVAQFFEGGKGDKLATGGLVEDWGIQKTREIADGITLCATGTRPEQLNITIADCGEGQSPDRLPDTILSLSKSNKQYIPFVQGQFNQGGTGALRFCGKNNLQLVISKRNPAFLDESACPRDREWSFTVVRREFPSGAQGTPKNSVYTYLAPLGVGSDCEDRHGNVLSFPSETFPIYPDDDGPYGREAPYGTAIKMYEYNFLGERSNILRGKSLLSRLDLLLPEIALPVRFYEYRTNKVGQYLDVGSRRTTVSGLLRRIKDSDNVEIGFPVRIPFQPTGEKLIANVFAFVAEGSTKESDEEDNGAQAKKLGGVRGYRKREGIVFLRNGQTQGSLPKDFFRREAVKMKPLADDLLVFVECDELSSVTREDLFMPSRDRLADNEFKQALVDSLEKAIRDCHELKELRNKRQQERMNERLQDDRPLTDVLQSLIKSSPNLTTLLKLGQRISAPFNTVPTGSETEEDFKGEVYPTFFKSKGIEYGKVLSRSCPINNRMRLTFETDARNDYFTRAAERGAFDLTWKGNDGAEYKASPNGPTLKKGIAVVMVDLPNGASVDDEFEFIARTHDAHRLFENRIKVRVKPTAEKTGGGGGERKPPKNKDGAERERPTELESPSIKRVYRDEWEAERFDEFTAMKIESLGYSDDETSEFYQFKVNMDNLPLESEAKNKRLSKESTSLLREQFLYANVLIGLSLLLEEKRTKRSERIDDDVPIETIEDRVERTCRAMAPFVPALISLGSSDLDSEDVVEGLEETA